MAYTILLRNRRQHIVREGGRKPNNPYVHTTLNGVASTPRMLAWWLDYGCRRPDLAT